MTIEELLTMSDEEIEALKVEHGAAIAEFQSALNEMAPQLQQAMAATDAKLAELKDWVSQIGN